jgi:hypothetical protein
MPRLEDYVSLTGIVLDNTRADIKFNFGDGEVWVSKSLILEDLFSIGDIKTWHIDTNTAIRLGLVN